MRTRKQIIVWLGTLSDKMLRSLADILWEEGKRRGWNQYWMD